MKIFCIDTNNVTNVNYFLQKMQIIFLKYEYNDGIWLHIDNIARYDQGPIITMSIGPEKIYYDFAPTLIHDQKDVLPIRIEIENGEIIIMDGSSRIEWSHGLPYGIKFNKTKYSILFKFDKFGEYNVSRNTILDTRIFSSAILCNYHNAKQQ